MKQARFLLLALLIFLVAACTPQPTPTIQPAAAADMANPASKYCVDQGYQSVIRDEAGGQVGYCVFPNGSECEEWAFYRGECAPAGESQAVSEKLANPASENCVAVGGQWSIENRVGGGQYGVCLFEDNRQCEEWALLRGDCPVGGVKVTGYATEAGRYCDMTGGAYAVTGSSGAGDEQGVCTLKDGTQCDAWDYYNGQCGSGADLSSAGATIQPLSMEVCDGEAQAMAHYLDVVEVTQSEEPLNDIVTGDSGTGCMSTVKDTGVKFESPDAALKLLDGMLKDKGWTEDPQLASGGPTGIGAGYRKGDQICLAAAGWQPDLSANCPKDQPVSTCQVKPEQQIYTVTLSYGVEAQSQ